MAIVRLLTVSEEKKKLRNIIWYITNISVKKVGDEVSSHVWPGIGVIGIVVGLVVVSCYVGI